jgi:hypothetical protein
VTVKVAAGEDGVVLARLREDEGVIGGGVDLDGQGFAQWFKGVVDGSVDLGDAAE